MLAESKQASMATSLFKQYCTFPSASRRSFSTKALQHRALQYALSCTARPHRHKTARMNAHDLTMTEQPTSSAFYRLPEELLTMIAKALAPELQYYRLLQYFRHMKNLRLVHPRFAYLKGLIKIAFHDLVSRFLRIRCGAPPYHAASSVARKAGNAQAPRCRKHPHNRPELTYFTVVLQHTENLQSTWTSKQARLRRGPTH